MLTLKFDLIDLLHRTVDDRRKRIALTPLVRNEQVKREFGQRAIERMIERMDDGIDKDGKDFKKYSPAYKKSLEFKAYGKSNLVNMELTGQMKTSLFVKRTTANGVTLGFSNKEANDKATGHVNGTGNLPVRDFWGLPDDDQLTIMQDVIKDFESTDTSVNEFIDALDSSSSVSEVQARIGKQAADFFIEDFNGE